MGHRLGRYELIRPLARGGMAEVFLARRRGPGGIEKRLVVKRIRRERARDPRFLALFVREARLSMSFAHKNIVPMFDFGRAGEELFLVMEYIEGVDLAAALKLSREHELWPSPILIAHIGLEACQGLDYAHNYSDGGDVHGVVHRDVTPRNVLLSNAGEVKLVDFGVASLEDDLSGERRIRGTPSYMSPEQAAGDPIDSRSDLFSLGLILWEALSGERAYKGSSTKDLIRQAVEANVPELPGSVPAKLAQIVRSATAKKREHRYASARDLQVALDRFMVEARSSLGDHQPPSHQLSTWLEMLGANAPVPAETVDSMELPEPVGEVVTFLEGGEAKFWGNEPDGAGLETIRSMAETVVGDDEARPSPTEAARSDSPLPEGKSKARPGIPNAATEISGIIGGASHLAPPPPSSDSISEKRGGAILALIVLAIIGAAGGILFISSNAQEAGLDAAPVAALSFDAAIPIPADASVPQSAPVDAATVPVDAAPPRKPIDGATRHVVPTAPTKTGTILINTNPWAKVRVVGSKEGCAETPCTLTLPEGNHRLQLDNPVAGVGKTISVTVTADQEAIVHETLTRPN